MSHFNWNNFKWLFDNEWQSQHELNSHFIWCLKRQCQILFNETLNILSTNPRFICSWFINYLPFPFAYGTNRTSWDLNHTMPFLIWNQYFSFYYSYNHLNIVTLQKNKWSYCINCSKIVWFVDFIYVVCMNFMPWSIMFVNASSFRWQWRFFVFFMETGWNVACAVQIVHCI